MAKKRWWCIRNAQDQQNSIILSPIRISTSTTNNTLPVIMNYSLEDEESVHIPVTVYRGAHSQYAAAPSMSPSIDVESSHSQVQVELHSYTDEGSNMMEMTKHDEISENIRIGGSKNQVPTACSWPSISGCISVKTPSIGSTQTSSSEYCGDYFSSTCDSGYSEQDICITGPENENFENFKIKCIEKDNFDFPPSTKSDKETQTDLDHLSPFSFNNCNSGQFDLGFHLDKVIETFTGTEDKNVRY